MKKPELHPAIRGGFNPEQQLPVVLEMSVANARLLHHIIAPYQTATAIDCVLSDVIELAENQERV